ncbi:MAG: hypothetical protein GWN14_05205 [candidate division Zixibacteria bacterium]|nr:hypothetical protein [candidate division Zixibacteria bacterium]
MSRQKVFIVLYEDDLPEVFFNKAEAIQAHDHDIADTGYYTDEPPLPTSSLRWSSGAFEHYFSIGDGELLDEYAPLQPSEMADMINGHKVAKLNQEYGRAIVTIVELIGSFIYAKQKVDELNGAPYSDATYHGLVQRIEEIEQRLIEQQLEKTMFPWEEPGVYWSCERGEWIEVRAPMREGDQYVYCLAFGTAIQIPTDGSAGFFLGPQQPPTESDDKS